VRIFVTVLVQQFPTLIGTFFCIKSSTLSARVKKGETMNNKTFSLIIIAVLLIIGAYAAIALLLTFGGIAYLTVH
jgi:hypothetical protein